MRLATASLAAALALATALPASAQTPKPEDEIRYRQSVLNVVGRAMGPMGAMAQGKAPFNTAVVQKNAALIETMLALPWGSFGAGTDKGAPTKADIKIWTETAKFKQASEASQKASTALVAAAKGGNEGAFKTAFGELGKTCKACHDDFRLKEFRN
jgi:cytochrome c556